MKRRIHRGEGSHGLVVISDSQTSGRGRWDRTWHSPSNKGLYCSALFSNDVIPPSRASLLTIGVGVAIAHILSHFTNLAIDLRWPNDLFYSGKKLGGILIENVEHFFVVGMGINVTGMGSDLPPDVREHAITLEEILGRSVSRTELLTAILDRLRDVILPTLSTNGLSLVTEWQIHSQMLGKPIHVEIREGNQTVVLQGIAQKLSEGGELIVQGFDGKLRKLVSGEVIRVI